jgi:cupin 2 domain-containing protein
LKQFNGFLFNGSKNLREPMEKKGSNNLFKNMPPDILQEITEKILSVENVRIERIISHGQSSPENFWYDQDENEWVIVLRGSAKLLFQEDTEEVLLNTGDYVNIPRHVKHRVEWTTPDEVTIWLAVFYI